jgi:hypothetical protein
MFMNRPFLALTLLLAAAALAQDTATPPPPKKLVGTKKVSAPKLDLGTVKFEDLPKDQLLQKPKTEEQQSGPSLARLDEAYSVVKVLHARAFLHGPDGARPSTPFPQVNLSGSTTEKFSTVVRVKSPGKRGAHIEVAILDPRGDTVMSAEGELVFRGGDETEWAVDWAPTGVRGPGDYALLVRVSGNPIGTFPIKIAETPK